MKARELWANDVDAIASKLAEDLAELRNEGHYCREAEAELILLAIGKAHEAIVSWSSRRDTSRRK